MWKLGTPVGVEVVTTAKVDMLEITEDLVKLVVEQIIGHETWSGDIKLVVEQKETGTPQNNHLGQTLMKMVTSQGYQTVERDIGAEEIVTEGEAEVSGEEMQRLTLLARVKKTMNL